MRTRSFSPGPHVASIVRRVAGIHKIFLTRKVTACMLAVPTRQRLGSVAHRSFHSSSHFEDSSVLSGTLDSSLEACGLELSDAQKALVEKYCQLLWEWNERLNLTRHLDYETFVARDVVDSMQLAAFLEPNESVLDFGSGGGVPGVLLAILRPDLDLTLCDSIEKKTKALGDIIDELGLPTSVITSRVQDLLPDERYDTLVARAVGPMTKVLGWVEPYWACFNRLILIKGPRWIEERGEARHRGRLKHLDLRNLKSYPMPGTESESVILSFQYRR